MIIKKRIYKTLYAKQETPLALVAVVSLNIIIPSFTTTSSTNRY